MIEIHKTGQTKVFQGVLRTFIQIPNGPHTALQHHPKHLPPSGKGHSLDKIYKTLDIPKNQDIEIFIP